MAEPRRLVPQAEPYDAGDPEQVKKAKDTASLREHRRKQVLRQLLSSPEGRDWVWDLLSRCNIYRTSIVPGDPYATFAAEGARNIGLGILADVVKASPENYVLMQSEAGKLDG